MKTEKSTQNATLENYKNHALDSRFRFLGGAAVAGIVFALCLYLITHDFTLAIDPDSRLATNLTILLLSLPVLCLLWFFRTHDTNEQIQKTQANINTSMLHKAIDLALAKETVNNRVDIDHVKRAIGLNMLAQLRRTDSEFEMQIDFVTKGLDLTNVNLADANLQEVYLQEACFNGARLHGANLEGARFNEARLHGANLEGTNLEEAVLQGARYDSTTHFPPDFNPQDAGMIEE